MKFIDGIGHNSDGFGGMQIFYFHFFLLSVSTKKIQVSIQSILGQDLVMLLDLPLPPSV
jgi:hypothetical protein